MTPTAKALINRFLDQGDYVSVHVHATTNHRFTAAVSIQNHGYLTGFSVVNSQSPEAALLDLWETLQRSLHK